MYELKKPICVALCSLILSLGINRAICCAQTPNTEEEERSTGAQEIAPEQLDNLENRSYDEAITIQDIQIEGNTLVSKEKILDQLKAKPGLKFSRDLVKEDLKSIYDMGYFTERLKAVPEPSPSGITLRIQVEENVPVTGFNITGNETVSTEEILSIIEEQAGLPQNITELNQAVGRIEKLYADKGYILARIKKVSDDPDGTINMAINEGMIDSVEISGNVKTKEYVIKRNLTVQPGEIYNEDKLKQDLTRIFGTQAFSDARRVISPSMEDPEKYKLTIEVDEKKTGSISLGGGVDTLTGLFGQAGYIDNNFLGRGQEVSTNIMVGSGSVLDDKDVLDRASYQFEAKFVEPRLMQSMTSLQVNAFGKDMASYQIPLSVERRIGGEIELARPLKQVKNLAGSVSIGFEDVDLNEGDADEIARIFKEKGIDIAKRAEQLKGGTFISLGPSIVYDSRNSLLNPTDGWYLGANFKESFAIMDSDAETFGRATLSVRKFFPVGEKSTFVLGGKMGSKVIGTVPEFEAFRLGGPYSVKGFREGDVGNGEGFMMATAEFRTPIPFVNKFLNYKIVRDLRLAFFMDAGQLFDETLTSELYNYPGYAVSIGTGLIVPLPYLGPIRVDYGYPLTSVGAGNKRGRFTFGIGERY
ncbi:MAG: hypothetical protein A2Y25_00315 [Candidatus Melainabacteria bacterium GWF2_37_15]|nr:MAG: hypothetical protein A2Y25_00315 [Candidatus Melainabacteria bacterium GWF2_37_15]